MKKLVYPKSGSADICLLVEGTYPFTRGGVSNWVYELIRFFPQYRFAIIFLGTRKKDYSGFLYTLLKNVVHLDAYYLYDRHRSFVYTTKRIKKKTMNKVVSMHDRFKSYTQDHSSDFPELFELMANNREINKKKFTRSRSAWEYIEKVYQEKYAHQSFFDYFWGVRSLHYPFWILKRIVDRIPKVKLVHSASTGYAGFLAALLQKKQNIPYVLTEHGIYSNERWIELMRHYFFMKIEQKNKRLNNELDLSSMWVTFFNMMAKISYRYANPIISLIEEYRQYQIKAGALPERTRIVSYGIDFEHYKFLGKSGPNQECPVIAFIGRVVPIKDVKTFIRAIALILQHKPAVEVWIAGTTNEDEEYVSSCKDLINFHGLQDIIKFLGYCNMMDLYQKIDLVILSSISEGSPFTILESFAVGVPVVATNVGGCKELIYGKDPEDQLKGEAGKLVNIADPHAIAKAALELLNNESTWVSAQQVGLERVRKYYGMQTLIDTYSQIYKEALSPWQA
jgi:polysaccharide biosynthesis protein PelF